MAQLVVASASVNSNMVGERTPRRRGFHGTFLAALFLMEAVLASYISMLKLDLIVTLAASISISLLVTVPNLRELASAVFPGTIKRGDEAAAKRLGGEVDLPDVSPGLWWIANPRLALVGFLSNAEEPHSTPWRRLSRLVATSPRVADLAGYMEIIVIQPKEVFDAYKILALGELI